MPSKYDPALRIPFIEMQDIVSKQLDFTLGDCDRIKAAADLVNEYHWLLSDFIWSGGKIIK